MSTVTAPVTNFVKLVIATIQGDEATVIGIKNQKKAISYIQAQLSVKDSFKINLEDAVEELEEKLALARINGGQKITSSDDYIRGLFAAEKKLTEAKEALELHNEEVAFLTAQLEIVKK